MASKFTPPIAALDLDPQIYSLVVKQGWSLPRAESAAFGLRCYFQAIIDNPGIPMVPSKEVDEVWHQAILDTQKYMDDCQSIFGRYLHHFPYSGLRGEEDAMLQAERYRASQELVDAIAVENS